MLGPNGAGKSTTIDIVLGLTRPDSGRVSLLGGPPGAAVDAGMVGAMLHSGALIRDVSVGELLGDDGLAVSGPAQDWGGARARGPHGVVDRRTQKLSGGQAQRVRFAVALVSDPAVLILDEPTAGMDVEARRGFWTSVRAFAARGKTIIFAMHYLEEADAYADRAILIAHGRVVADGPTTEISARVGRRTIRATLRDVDPAVVVLPARSGGGRSPRRGGRRDLLGLRRGGRISGCERASRRQPPIPRFPHVTTVTPATGRQPLHGAVRRRRQVCPPPDPLEPRQPVPTSREGAARRSRGHLRAASRSSRP